MQNVIIIGATSAIAQETARCYASEGAALFLVARSAEKLEALAADLRIRGHGKVETMVCDLLDFNRHAEIVDKAWGIFGRVDAVLIAHGTLGDQKRCEEDYAEAEKEYRSNFLSVVSLCTPIANRLEKQGSGTLAVISSVAGMRGRQSNYIYGSAKGAKSLYLQGLRNRMHHKGVKVVSILPGFVDTPMTAGFKKNGLYATAADVGAGIHKAMKKGREVVFLPWFWRWIMFIICSIPERIFKKLKL